MKKLCATLALGAFLLGTSAIQAQAPSCEARCEKQTAKMTEMLNLDARQAEQVKAINLKYAKELEAVRSERESGNAANARSKTSTIKQQKTAELSKVLDSGQLAQYQTYERERSAKGKPHGPRGHKANPEMKKAMNAYVKTKVLPTVKTQRQKLDRVIERGDQKTISQLRATGKRHLMAMKEVKNKAKGYKENGQEVPQELKDQMKNMRDQRKAHMEPAKKLAEKYSTNIEALKNEISSEREGWKNDLKAIAEKYGQEGRPAGRPEGRPSMGGDRNSNSQRPTKSMRPDSGERKGAHGGKGFHGNGRGPLGKILSDVGFLLLDPNSNDAELFLDEDFQKGPVLNENRSGNSNSRSRN